MKINNHISQPSAFISSTFIDLQEERKQVAAILIENGFTVNALEVKPAANGNVRNEIQRGIKESDFIILVVGERYGSIIPKLTLSKSMSITKWEYKFAVNTHGKDALVFFKNVISEAPVHYDDRTLVDFQLKQRLLKEFKAELSIVHKADYFSTAEELAQKVKKALIPTYRDGARALLTKVDDHLREIDRLKQENRRLLSVRPNHFSDNSILDFTSSERVSGLIGSTSELTNKPNNPAAFGLTRSVRGGLAKK